MSELYRHHANCHGWSGDISQRDMGVLPLVTLVDIVGFSYGERTLGGASALALVAQAEGIPAA